MTEFGRDFARFIALHDDIQPTEYTFASEICTLGRSLECQIVVPRNIVSRLHARIEREGPRCVLRDAGSANGTFVNQQRIREPHVLKHRDVIGLGAATPLLRFIDPDPTFEPMPLLRYDEQQMQFFVGTQLLELTPTQFRLLRHLYQHAGSVCTREGCLEAIWGPAADQTMNDEALDGVVSSLRRKLRELDPNADCIKTRRGLGYDLIL